MAKSLHTRMKVFSRSRGDSAVAAAAYRSGTNLLDERATEIKKQKIEAQAIQDNQPVPDYVEPVVHYYRRKSDVLRDLSEIVVPDTAPAWAGQIATEQDRQTFYNLVEATEKRVDSQLLREFEGELSRHLDMGTNKKLLRALVVDQFVARGMIADINIHNHMASDGGENPHFHVLLTMRDLEENGFGNKNREWNNYYSEKRQDVVANALRTDLADRINAEHEKAGVPVRIDPRSYEEQGIDVTPGIHIGKDAFHLEEKGTISRLGNALRGIHIENSMRDFAKSMALEHIEEEVEEVTLREHLRELPTGFEQQSPEQDRGHER